VDKRFTFAPKAEIAGRDHSVVKLVRVILDEPEGDDEFYDSFCISDESKLFDFIPVDISVDDASNALQCFFNELIPDSMLSADLPDLLGYLDARFPGWDNRPVRH
jgi:hypothetical protein